MKKHLISNRLTFLTFLFFSSFGLSSCKVENVNLDSWEASTIHECVQETACAWRVFQESILDAHGLFPYIGKRKIIPKWHEDIRFQFLGDTPDQSKHIVDKTAKMITPYFPYGMKISESPNLIFIFFDGITIEAINEFRSNIQNFTGLSDQKYEQLSAMYGRSKSKCISLKTAEREKRTGFLVLVDKNSAEANKCVVSNIFASMGVDYTWPPLLKLNDYKIEPKKADKVTDLHLITLKIFYDKNFPEILSYEGGKQAFLEIYPKILKAYNASKK